MITPDNALWCLTVLLIFLAAWGLMWWLGRERPTDWDAPGDLDEVDAAYVEARAMQTAVHDLRHAGRTP